MCVHPIQSTVCVPLLVATMHKKFVDCSVQICMNLVVYRINVPFVLRNMVESLIFTRSI